MSAEEKGFVIKDRRAFDERGELKEETVAPEGGATKKEAVQEKRKTETRKHGEKDLPPLPEVNFASLIFSLSSTALFHMGEIADPGTGETTKDLRLAKHTVDTIAMLKEKTKGNLTGDEEKFLDSILADLRWRYVKAAQ
jgi:hypothetical protein